MYAQKYGIDPTAAWAVAQIGSGGQMRNSSNAIRIGAGGGVGIMQIKPSVFYSLTDADGNSFTNINDPNQNMEAGVVYLAQQYQTYGTYSAALSAYGGSQQYAYTGIRLMQAAGSLSSDAQPQNALRQMNNYPDPSDEPTASIASAVHGQQDIPTSFTASLNSTTLQITDASLSETAWYDDRGLVTGNPRIRQSVQPVIFTVFLDRQQTNGAPLNNPATNQPIQLQLNCSLTTFSIESRHVYNRTPSRTGMHITFWGMNPDLISGQGSTGVFMNQFGITDYFSVANVSDDMKDQVTSGLINQIIPTLAGPDTTISSPDQLYSMVVQKNATQNSNEAFRVAAQDAFVEFMKLFQMNGNVWFQSPSSQGDQTGKDQTGVNAWSQRLGTSTFQQSARNNDVLSRGYVEMQFRNNIYLGYFKSLSWVQDAEKPFSWSFNFTFQVERTIAALIYPSYSTGQQAAPESTIG